MAPVRFGRVAWLVPAAILAFSCATEHEPMSGPSVKLAARKATPLYGQAAPAPSDDGDDDEMKDYWEGVEFGPDDFAEVRRFVKLFYIDQSYDKHLAWISAANFALHTMTKPRELLPDDFYRAKKASKDASKVAGDVLRLKKSDLFIVLEMADPQEKKPAAALTPKELRARKRDARKWQEDLEKGLSRVPFSEADFDRVLDFIKTTEENRPATAAPAPAAANGAPPHKFRMADLYVAAAQGYLATLDPHSTIISAKAWDESTKSTTDGSFEGIGAVLTKKGEETIVETPMEGQPAYRAGVRAGDTIVSVDHKSVTGLELHKVVKRIRGAKGTAVVLTVRRLGEPKDLDFTIQREHIEVRNVQSRMLDRHPDVGYLKMTGFVPTTEESMEGAIASLEKNTKGGRLRGLVLDLRNNSGGLLQESVEVADDFLDSGVIVSVKNPSDRDEVYKANPGGHKFPMIVLVNDGSASAAEILASAVQENQRALVVGERTFGKASVQTLLNPLLRRDYYIKLTVARYYGPTGRTLQVTGVVPDIAIPPGPGEEAPVGFREEDLAHHLSKLSGEYPPMNKALVQKVLDCEKRMGVADQVARSDPNPQVKIDYELLKAADYLECVIALKDGGEPSHDAGE